MKNKLRVLRAERRWSQADLGKQVSVSRQAINAIETGKHIPSLPLAFKLAEAFDLRVDEVFNPMKIRKTENVAPIVHSNAATTFSARLSA